jgi:hypothetical protein
LLLLLLLLQLLMQLLLLLLLLLLYMPNDGPMGPREWAQDGPIWGPINAAASYGAQDGPHMGHPTSTNKQISPERVLELQLHVCIHFDIN